VSEQTDIRALVTDLAERARKAARKLAGVPTARKNAVLRRAAAEIRGPAREAILEANRLDVEEGRSGGLGAALLDRLSLTPERLEGVAAGVEHVAGLPDPVGTINELRRLENGLEVGRMRVPLGVIGMIYESRPNVTADAAALCLKSGNAVLLRGGKEAFRSNQAFAAVFATALGAEGLPQAAVTLLPTTDREATRVLIGLDGLVDLIIPRGGESLIRFVADNARVPVVQHYKGVCHVYVDVDADLTMALDVAVNSKTDRTGVCNAMETLLVDRACAERFIPPVVSAMRERGVELRGDAAVRNLTEACAEATEDDWDTEYLDSILSIAIVDGIEGALDHVARHGSHHTEAIVTKDYAKARRWLREVDASLVLVNASTRFNDGAQLGLGAEIGISTTKLHAYGPMGLAELCAQKWVAFGDGQVRG